MFMRREVAMNHRVVIGRIRLVHVFRWDRGRHGEPWHQGRDGQDPAYRSHRHVDYMRRDILSGKLTKSSETPDMRHDRALIEQLLGGIMTTKTVQLAIATAVTLLIPAAAGAHVSITPRDSTAGATEKYVVRVPTEGKVTTTGAELEVPDGVVVEVLAVPAGWKYEVKRKGDRIVAITWQSMATSPATAAFSLVPTKAAQVLRPMRALIGAPISVSFTSSRPIYPPVQSATTGTFPRRQRKRQSGCESGHGCATISR
jgi:hypothetical protein